MRFNFPDVADFPENVEAVRGGELTPPNFGLESHFLKDFGRLVGQVAGFCECREEEDILKTQVARILAAHNSYRALPVKALKAPNEPSDRLRPANGPLSNHGVLSCIADVERLVKKFNAEIKQARAIEPSGGIRDIDRAVTRTDEEAVVAVQSFLVGAGLMRQACAYRGTVAVRSVTIHVSRPGDQHHYQQFRDCETTTKLINLHMDPKPGVLKAIVYLGEVTEDNGPFQCVRGSNRWDVDNVQRIFAWGNSVGNYCHTPRHRKVANMFPSRFRRNSIVGRLIPDGSSQSDFLLKNLTTFTSDDANTILFDPCFVLHRGGQCKKGERVNLQVVLK